jgi:hypothetical protein
MTAEPVAANDAMVNRDTLGLAPTEIWSSHSDNKLIAALGLVASLMKLPVSAVHVDQIGSSDSVQFVPIPYSSLNPRSRASQFIP